MPVTFDNSMVTVAPCLLAEKAVTVPPPSLDLPARRDGLKHCAWKMGRGGEMTRRLKTKTTPPHQSCCRRWRESGLGQV